MLAAAVPKAPGKSVNFSFIFKFTPWTAISFASYLPFLSINNKVSPAFKVFCSFDTLL